ncbi:hypothetical protein KGA66_07525 [Actinocrinis puniceicyclus]|uniref:PknH-like extracellular domain-containing protein n=1 Tax=Actinocrinis puniceicyclus TaxID=977794 RepID=A0A8J8BAE9_9ACTN|nr:hypothetical protein [Actinocrinis puniceicyclus]MBS2962887.1 hypothetical protein [Actinocrinis puniceicyclus]
MRALSIHTCIATVSSAALVALGAGGCSSSNASTDTAGAQPAPSSSATASPGLGSAPPSGASPSGLAAKLLTPADLPAGWGIDATATNPPMQSGCGLWNPAVWNGSLAGRAEADLSAGLTGPFLVEELAAGTSAQVASAWQKLVGSLSQCTTYTHGGGSGSSTFTTARASLPAYGDGSYSFTLNIKVSTGVDASGYIVAARSGNSVVVVYIVALAQPAKNMADAAFGKAVAKARS